jgi:hypothetical protein
MGYCNLVRTTVLFFRLHLLSSPAMASDSGGLVDPFELLSEHFYEINLWMWGNLRVRLIFPNITRGQFPPLVKKKRRFDVPDGIIAHLMTECGGNVADVTCESSKKETWGTNPHSGPVTTILIVL